MSTIGNRWDLSRPRSKSLGISLTVFVCAVVFFACMIGVVAASPRGAALHFAWNNQFDVTVESHLNRLVNRWQLFDSVMLLLTEHNLLKGAPIVFLCWAAFFEKRPAGVDPMEGRRKLLSVIPFAIASVILARILTTILPFRERPFRTAALHFQLPPANHVGSLYAWSSFPSDHAMLFMALAVGVFFASRRLGSLAICYVVLFIIGPRLYLGIHWPTDVLAGAALGTAMAAIATTPVCRNFVCKWAEKGWHRFPGIFAASAFLLSYEITDLFATPIAIASMLLKHMHP